MPSTKLSPEAKRRAMLRAQARLHPTLLTNLREDIHTCTIFRRRIERMLAGELHIPTRATPAKLRAQLAELDAELLRLGTDLQHLTQP